jgi:hypothetical protein
VVVVVLRLWCGLKGSLLVMDLEGGLQVLHVVR